MDLYRRYWKLRDAVNCINNNQERFPNLRVWAFESPMGNGVKQFFVATKTTFYRRYLRNNARYFYEIIEPHRTCRLFFDVDVVKELNPDFDEKGVTNVFFTLLQAFVFESHHVQITFSDIVHLDASTDAKVSWHFIVHGFKFDNILHCRSFIQRIATELRECFRNLGGLSFSTDSFTYDELLKLRINTPSGYSVLFDENVYCSNQQFRLINSEKRGKNNPLVLSENNHYPVFNEETLFDDCLISFDDDAPSVSASVAKSHPSITKSSAKTTAITFTTTSTNKSTTSSSSMSTVAKSLNDFVLAYAQSFIRTAQIGKVTRLENKMKFDLNGTKWCQNISREHKSNRVYIVVDLRKGCMYQRCYDPDCKQAYTASCPVPHDLCTSNML